MVAGGSWGAVCAAVEVGKLVDGESNWDSSTRQEAGTRGEGGVLALVPDLGSCRRTLTAWLSPGARDNISDHAAYIGLDTKLLLGLSHTQSPLPMSVNLSFVPPIITFRYPTPGPHRQPQPVRLREQYPAQCPGDRKTATGFLR